MSAEGPAGRVSWRTLRVDGARVRVLEAGPPDADPLLFLHGWGLSPAAYEGGLVRLTAAGVRVVAPCLPGFGGSDGPALGRVGLPAYAGRVRALLDALGLRAPVFVAGHSFGGGVALQLASETPDRVRALTLVDPVGGGGGTLRRWAAGALHELHPADLLRSAPGVLRTLLPNAARRPLTLALTARLALTASLAPQARELVAAGMPVLFVWGEEDRLTPSGGFGDVACRLPADLVPGRHGWLLAHPGAFAALLGDALVVHALLERRGPERPGPERRGCSRPAVVLPPGVRLADLLPGQRRSPAVPAARPAGSAA